MMFLCRSRASMNFPYPLFLSCLHTSARSALLFFFFSRLLSGAQPSHAPRTRERSLPVGSLLFCRPLKPPPLVHVSTQQRVVNQQPLCGQRANEFFRVSTLSACAPQVNGHFFQTTSIGTSLLKKNGQISSNFGRKGPRISISTSANPNQFPSLNLWVSTGSAASWCSSS